MKKSLVLLAICIAGILTAKAQSDYKSAIGGRLGSPLSFSYKTFITKPGAIELNAGFAPLVYGAYFRVGGMYQHHFPIGDIDGFKWYVGGGAFFDIYSYKGGYGGYGNTSFGINAVGGVDYKFKTIPLNLSADWMPSILFGNNLYYSSNFRPGYGAVSVRYVLK